MNSKSILFVDDEMFYMAPTIEALDKDGYTIHKAQNGYEVLKYLNENKDNPPTLVVLDIMMPEFCEEIVTNDEGRSTGIELFKKIREVWGNTFPIVISSVVNDNEILDKLYSDNNVSILNKPYIYKELKEAINIAISN